MVPVREMTCLSPNSSVHGKGRKGYDAVKGQEKRFAMKPKDSARDNYLARAWDHPLLSFTHAHAHTHIHIRACKHKINHLWRGLLFTTILVSSVKFTCVNVQSEQNILNTNKHKAILVV